MQRKGTQITQLENGFEARQLDSSAQALNYTLHWLFAQQGNGRELLF